MSTIVRVTNEEEKLNQVKNDAFDWWKRVSISERRAFEAIGLNWL